MGVPDAGVEFQVVDDERMARSTAEARQNELRLGKLSGPRRVDMENLLDAMAAGMKKCLNVVLKCDVRGSCEAIMASLGKIRSDKVDLKILHSAIGPVTEADVLLAQASAAIIIGFNVRPDRNAAEVAEREQVEAEEDSTEIE